MNNDFPCDKCGLCCRNISMIPQLKEFDDGTGVCKYLRENLCSIYEKRPAICNVELMYEKYYKQQYSKQAFYELNQKGCMKLKLKNSSL